MTVAPDDPRAVTDWSTFNACPTCRAVAGKPCRALSGRVAGGQPDGQMTELQHAHHRRRRSLRAR